MAKVSRIKKMGRWIGAIKSGYHQLLGKDLSAAVNKKAVQAVGSIPTFKKGGKVKKTGLVKLHAGEIVLSVPQRKALKKLLH